MLSSIRITDEISQKDFAEKIITDFNRVSVETLRAIRRIFEVDISKDSAPVGGIDVPCSVDVLKDLDVIRVHVPITKLTESSLFKSSISSLTDKEIILFDSKALVAIRSSKSTDESQIEPIKEVKSGEKKSDKTQQLDGEKPVLQTDLKKSTKKNETENSETITFEFPSKSIFDRLFASQTLDQDSVISLNMEALKLLQKTVKADEGHSAKSTKKGVVSFNIEGSNVNITLTSKDKSDAVLRQFLPVMSQKSLVTISSKLAKLLK